MTSRLATEIAGLKLTNPTMLAAGILGLSPASLRRVVEAGAGAVVTKSVGLKPREGYLNPTVAQVDCGLLNAMGLPNPGVHHLSKELRGQDVGAPIIMSIYGFSPADFADVAGLAIKAGIDALELNLSCPHVERTGVEIGHDPRLVAEVMEKVKAEVDSPVFVKLSPNVVDIVEVAKAAVESGADAVTAVNTVRAMKIDVETGRPVLANAIGGLSGPAMKPVAVRCVYEIHRAIDVPIIGCGGISNWGDAVEFMLAGASAVQIGTAIADKDLGVFGSVTEGMETYLEAKGFGSVKEIVGLAHRC